MAHYKDLTIDQGSDVAIELHLVNPDKTPKDLTGYSVAAKLAPNYNASDSDRTPFDAIVANPTTSGIVTLGLTNTQTDALKAKRKYVYDVEISYVSSDSDGELLGNFPTITERIMEGLLFVTPSVTK